MMRSMSGKIFICFMVVAALCGAPAAFASEAVKIDWFAGKKAPAKVPSKAELISKVSVATDKSFYEEIVLAEENAGDPVKKPAAPKTAKSPIDITRPVKAEVAAQQVEAVPAVPPANQDSAAKHPDDIEPAAADATETFDAGPERMFWSVKPLHRKWSAQGGESLRRLLDFWSGQAGVDFVWNTDAEYRVLQTVDVEGNYTAAVRSVLAQYGGNPASPVAQLYIDPRDGKRTLVVNGG